MAPFISLFFRNRLALSVPIPAAPLLTIRGAINASNFNDLEP